MSEYQLALDKAKIQLMTRKDTAFFTTVAFSLIYKWDASVPTAATNGKSVIINPTFFMSLSPEERIFLILHESMHVAYLHMERLKERDHARFNVAADHVINLSLIARGYTMPTVGLADPQYRDLSTEEVYDLLPPQDPNNVDMDIMPADTEDKELRTSVEEILIRAAIQSKLQEDAPGTIPGELQIFLNSLLLPKLPWNRILKRYLQSKAKSNYSFRKPNRRFFPDYHLPSLESEGVIDLAIAIDASGSVSTDEFTQFISEINSIFRMMKPEKITLIQFDSAISSVRPIRSIQELSKVLFVGRGGTKIEPVMNWAAEHKPKVLLVFTDGEFSFKTERTQEVLWLIHNNTHFTAPYGKVIHYTI